MPGIDNKALLKHSERDFRCSRKSGRKINKCKNICQQGESCI